MRVASPIADLSDNQLETLVLAWMAQELSIAPEGASIVLRLLAGGRDPESPFDRLRAIELTKAPEDLCEAFVKLDSAVESFIDSYLIDILTTSTYSIAVSAFTSTRVAGVTEDEVPYLYAYLKAQGILVSRSAHHWPGYEHWHLDPIFVEQYRKDLQLAAYTPSARGGTIGDRLNERIAQLLEVARAVNQYALGTALPTDPELALECLAAKLSVSPLQVLAAERLLLAERDTQLPPVVTVRWAA